MTLIVSGRERAIADVMEQMAVDRKVDGFKRDAGNVRDSQAVILIGVRGGQKHWVRLWRLRLR